MRYGRSVGIPLLFCACAAFAGEEGGDALRGVRIQEPAFSDPRVEVQDSRVRLLMTREMPTPGWTFNVDAVRRDAGRITVELSELRPSGMVAQVISRAELTVPLGALEPGVYFVELRLRGQRQEVHLPVQALVLQAYR